MGTERRKMLNETSGLSVQKGEGDDDDDDEELKEERKSKKKSEVHGQPAKTNAIYRTK